MIEQQARVISQEGDLVRVRIGGQSGCTACDSGKGCGAGLFGKLLNRKPVELTIDNRIGAQIGQPVQLGLSEALFLKWVFRLYGWPLFAGLIGAMVGHKLAEIAGYGVTGLDLAALTGAVLAAGTVLIYWSKSTKPDINSSDIQMLDIPIAANRCDASQQQAM